MTTKLYVHTTVTLALYSYCGSTIHARNGHY